MIRSYEKKCGCLAELNWGGFLSYIHDQANGLCASTRRQYRSALRYHLVEEKGVVWTEVAGPDFLVGQLNRKEVKLNKGLRTSQLKFKSMPDKAWTELMGYLKTSRSKHARLAYDLLLATRFFGLRPVEWINATLKYDHEKSRSFLMVQNAKHSDGRAHGETRKIWFDIEGNSEQDEEVYYAVAEVIRVLKACDKKAAKRIIHVRNYLSQVYARHSKFKKYKGNKRITLYSARHQFAADLKKQGLSKDKIAALMGHRSVDTATRAYGRKMFGKGGLGVQADMQDVDRVKAFNSEPVEELSADFGM